MKPRPLEGDVTKLPKWAQDRIRFAERDRDHWEAEAHRYAKNEPTEIALVVHRPIDREDHFLPRHSTIRFYLNEDRSRYIEARVHSESGELNLNTGSGRLCFFPKRGKQRLHYIL